MVKCIQCHTENNTDQTYCKQCNTHLLKEEGYQCPSCKVDIGPFASTCRNCGQHIPKRIKSHQRDFKQQIEKVSGGVVEFRQRNIVYHTLLNESQKEQLIWHYNNLCKKLKIAPKVVVYSNEQPRLYCSHRMRHLQNVIKINDQSSMILDFIMQMRYVYLANHKKSMYRKTLITNANQFIDSVCEQDVIRYSLSYCKKFNLVDELRYLNQKIKQYEAYRNGQISAMEAGINESYIRLNPTYPLSSKKTKHHANIKKNSFNMKSFIIPIILGILLLIGLVNSIIHL